MKNMLLHLVQKKEAAQLGQNAPQLSPENAMDAQQKVNSPHNSVEKQRLYNSMVAVAVTKVLQELRLEYIRLLHRLEHHVKPKLEKEQPREDYDEVIRLQLLPKPKTEYEKIMERLRTLENTIQSLELDLVQTWLEDRAVNQQHILYALDSLVSTGKLDAATVEDVSSRTNTRWAARSNVFEAELKHANSVSAQEAQREGKEAKSAPTPAPQHATKAILSKWEAGDWVHMHGAFVDHHGGDRAAGALQKAMRDMALVKTAYLAFLAAHLKPTPKPTGSSAQLMERYRALTVRLDSAMERGQGAKSAGEKIRGSIGELSKLIDGIRVSLDHRDSQRHYANTPRPVHDTPTPLPSHIKAKG